MLKPLGRLVVLILVGGLAFGGFRLYQGQKGKIAPGAFPKFPGVPTSAPNDTPSRNTAPDNGGHNSPSLVLITSATKKGWLENEVEQFNATKGGKVTIKYLETREAMQAILNNKQTPTLWSPSSPIWATRLSEKWQADHGGETLINANDPNTYRIYLRTPIVFLTTKSKASFLRPLLSGNRAWQNIADLSAGKKRIPGATHGFVWAHADPIASNSGFLTLGLILDAYVQSKGGTVTPEDAANSSGFMNYLQQVEKTLPANDAAVRGGSSTLLKAFLDAPNRYDVITTYESSALEALAKNPDIAVLYPNPTAVSEQTVAVVQGAWTTPDQKQEAAELLTFLGSDDSLRDGVNNNFRPTHTSGSISLAPEITRHQAQGFQQTFSSVEFPSYEALNDCAVQWRKSIAKIPGN